jgi:hypothetical protein
MAKTKLKKIKYFLPKPEEREAFFARLIDEAAQRFIGDPGFDLARLPTEAVLWLRDDGSYFFAEVSEDYTDAAAEMIGAFVLNMRGSATKH